MSGEESIAHSLAFAVRVDDAFTDAPVADQLEVTANDALPVVSGDRRGTRQPDGTYRFIDLASGTYQLRVASPHGFTWAPTTPVTVPLADRRQPIAVTLWPTPDATAPRGVVAIRGVLITAPAGQAINIEPVATPALGKRTRCDATGEFLYVLAGWTQLDPISGLVQLVATVPGRSVASVDVLDAGSQTSYPGLTFAVPPGRDTRVRFHLV